MKRYLAQRAQQEDQTQVEHMRAIAYFIEKIKPSKETITDCAEELEIFHHRCELGQYALAQEVIDICVDFLKRQGYYGDLIRIHERLTAEWYPQNPKEQHNLGWAWARLGNLYRSVGKYRAAISSHKEAQAKFNQIDFSKGKAASLGNLGNVYQLLGQYEQAINFHQQSLEITREIGDRWGEAASLFNKSLALARYEPRCFQALVTLQQAREIYAELQLDHRVEKCDEEIYAFNRIIATEQRQSVPILPPTPTIDNAPPQDDWYGSQPTYQITTSLHLTTPNQLGSLVLRWISDRPSHRMAAEISDQRNEPRSFHSC
ncbi:tetratricopeptide repeat protein [Phormidesmis priestleyi ULC007]|uniref:Tetratricopeptide repeat protein n=1 Tax=Phormidesmis priestleyi ULC007 TaxID=1920490 RepID=A0A2T1DHV8_9CYAN|nr:tetratricopeptide repeat protein [Phormidesmis priestleyi]PSB20056.1 tetratricopeptide repeat protein [Phormidesmis priestleyi ULC007]PZO48920.1 MAG: tetratricopeptide repeat protein [Phormidesmis priestleyi]